MVKFIEPGAGIILMKVGTHAKEDLTAIIARKKKEIDDAGFGMWDYGGGTCHPGFKVQPFAERFAAENKPIYLCMEKMTSNHFAEQLAAKEYSADNKTWKEIPPAINVLGSRYALMIGDLQEEEFELPLNQTKVAIGDCQGRLGSRYIKGRVDKGCLEVMEKPELVNAEKEMAKVLRVSLVARILEPYAVFLRDFREKNAA
jgi:hypothetical protein